MGSFIKLEKITPETVTPELNQQLLDFFTPFHVNAWVELKIDRQKDFFGLYKTQSPDFRCYIMRDVQSGKIEACASFVIRETMVQKELTKIAYASDLRVSSSRRAILEWSQHFLPTLDEVRAELNVKQFFSVINLSENTLINAFLRPRTMRRTLPRYYLYRKFNLHSIHGRFPFAPKPLPSLRIREGSEASKDALLGYLLRKFRYRPFASVWDGASFERKMERLTGFKISDFLIAYDSQEQIVGCLAPWSPQVAQKLIPISYELPAHNFRQFLKFGQLLGWSHPLTKPVRSTGVENPLNFRWLTHLAIDNEDVFDSLLWKAYERLNKNEFLAYTQVEQDFRSLPPSTWISASVPHAIYSVTDPSEERPSFLHPSETLNPEVEAIFI